MSDGTATKERVRDWCVAFAFTIGWLALLAFVDAIDFHVCIKNAGHCKIIDPTKFDVVPKNE